MNTIVIGGGTNGLAAAITLAKSGHKVVLFERAAELGGIARSVEFHPGYRSAGVMDLAAVDATGAALGLPSIPAPPLVGSFGGARVTLDASNGAKLSAFLDSIRPVLGAELGREPPRIDPGAPVFPLIGRGFSARRAGAAVLASLMRVPLMSASDWLGEVLGDPRLCGLVAAPGLVGGVIGPRQPTTAALVLHERLRGDRVILGPTAVATLVSLAKAAGVDLRTSSPVAKIRVRQGAAVGVTLEDGTEADAAVVVACCDPRVALMDLLDPLDTPNALRRTAVGIRAKGAVAHLLFATDAQPGFAETSLWLDPELEGMERAFNAVKYTVPPTLPEPIGPLHVVVPSRLDPSLAPGGGAVVSVRWIAAYPGTRWDAEKQAQIADAVLGVIERHAPGFSSTVVGRQVRGPGEIGHVFHAEHAFDQLWTNRPAYGLLPGQLAVSGLVLGSAGAHPGGGLAGSAGALAGRLAG